MLPEQSLLPRRSLRWKIALTVAVTALLVILAQAVAFLLVLEEQEEDHIDALLNRQIAISIDAAQRGMANIVQPSSAMLFLVDGPGAPLPAELQALPIGNHEIFRGGNEVHVALREAGGVRYALTYDVAEHEARIDNLVQLTVSGAVAIGLVTLLTIYFVAGRLTGDLTEIAHRVESAETDERPLFHPHMTREVAVVAQALDRARGRQADVLAREREFTANLSHELRTPLSVIRSDAEMLAELPDMPECVRKRAASIIARSDEIAELTKGLLELARETRPGRPEPVELAEVIEAIWARVGGAASALSLGIDRRVCLSVDPRLLDIVISNVLANALRHGARACACDFSAATLSLADDGPGVGEAALPRIFSRHMRGGSSKGFGLGLALVAQVCAACGWEVEAANGRAGGLVVRITFTPSQILHGPLTLS